MTRAALLVLVLLLVGAGCTSPPAGDTYRVGDDDRLVLDLAPGGAPTVEVLNRTEEFTLSRLVFSGSGVPVTAYLGAPLRPAAGVVYVPGANEPVSGHEERFGTWAAAGFAFLYLDIRGNGFETPGDRTDLEVEYAQFARGEWPQSFRIVADAVRARAYLDKAYGVPVWAVGSSNGGRYAAVAAAVDPAFAGYAGVSTSGFDLLDGVGAGPGKFLASIDPGSNIGSISPRPVLLYHAPADPVIPYADGRALFLAAREPKTFVPFPGSHGIDPRVDADLIGRLTQVYAR